MAQPPWPCSFCFTQPSQDHITRISNLVYNDDEDGESRGELDGGGDDGSDDDIEEIPRGQSGRRWAPTDPSAGTFGAIAATSSRAMCNASIY